MHRDGLPLDRTLPQEASAHRRPERDMGREREREEKDRTPNIKIKIHEFYIDQELYHVFEAWPAPSGKLFRVLSK